MNGRRPRKATAASAAVAFPVPIEKGIAIPPTGKRRNSGKKPFYPFGELKEVGDSFFISLDDHSKWREENRMDRMTLKRLWNSCYAAGYHYRRGKGNERKTFTARMYTTPEEGVRVWRTA